MSVANKLLSVDRNDYYYVGNKQIIYPPFVRQWDWFVFPASAHRILSSNWLDTERIPIFDFSQSVSQWLQISAKNSPLMSNDKVLVVSEPECAWCCKNESFFVFSAFVKININLGEQLNIWSDSGRTSCGYSGVSSASWLQHWVQRIMRKILTVKMDSNRRILFGIFVCVISVRAFNFPTDTASPAPGPPPPAAAVPGIFAADDLSRQIVITPAIVTPTNSCICVPTGQCNFGGGVPGNTDGSGLIDIRIVNSVSDSDSNLSF